MKYLKLRTSNILTIEKSEFISIIMPLNSTEEVSFLLQNIRKEYPKATHYCHAYIFGDYQEYGASSDDGEPQRTAGIPIFESLKQHQVTNTLCVVIRYFGGIKLGAGGLIRAYAQSASDVLKLGVYYEKIPAYQYEIRFNYELIQTIDRLLSNDLILDKSFTEHVTYTFTSVKPRNELFANIEHLIKINDIKETVIHQDCI